MKFRMPVKNKYLRLLVYTIIIFITFRFIVMFGAVGGTFGLRTKTHGCIGLTLTYETVSKYFPEGEVEIGFLGFRYFVPKKSEIRKDSEKDCLDGRWCMPSKYSFITQDTKFCLGQDVWLGE